MKWPLKLGHVYTTYIYIYICYIRVSRGALVLSRCESWGPCHHHGYGNDAFLWRYIDPKSCSISCPASTPFPPSTTNPANKNRIMYISHVFLYYNNYLHMYIGILKRFKNVYRFEENNLLCFQHFIKMSIRRINYYNNHCWKFRCVIAVFSRFRRLHCWYFVCYYEKYPHDLIQNL